MMTCHTEVEKADGFVHVRFWFKDRSAGVLTFSKDEWETVYKALLGPLEMLKYEREADDNN